MVPAPDDASPSSMTPVGRRRRADVPEFGDHVGGIELSKQWEKSLERGLVLGFEGWLGSCWQKELR